MIAVREDILKGCLGKEKEMIEDVWMEQQIGL